MKGKLFNVKLTDGNTVRAIWQYECSPEEALCDKAIKVKDVYTKKAMYIPVHSISYITEDSDANKIGF